MEFTYQGQTHSYTIVRKRIKNTILHVQSDGSIYVSAPPHVPEKHIQEFVEEKAAELVRQIRKRQEDAPDYADGSTVQYLGEPLTLHYSATPCRTTLSGNVLTLYARDAAGARLAYLRWLTDECLALYRQINREVYTVYTEAGHKVPLARIEIKDMKSRWGSCTAKTGRISINFRLMQYPVGCIYSVFYHEYAHFMHQDHSKAFYAVLRGAFPAYDQWDAVLNHRKRRLG